MAIKTIVTRGYGNGTFSGTVAKVVTRGYGIGVTTTIAAPFADTVRIKRTIENVVRRP